MSAHDWPDFGKHPNPCYTENGNGDRYAIRLSREAYNYAKVRIDACAGIPTEALEVTHGLDDIYNDIIRERDVEMAKRVIAEQQNAAYIAAACPANILPILESYEELLAASKGYLDNSVSDIGRQGRQAHGALLQAITNAEKLSQ